MIPLVRGSLANEDSGQVYRWQCIVGCVSLAVYGRLYMDFMFVLWIKCWDERGRRFGADMIVMR